MSFKTLYFSLIDYQRLNEQMARRVNVVNFELTPLYFTHDYAF